MGITSVTDMSARLRDIRLVEDLLKEGQYKLRYYGCLIDFTGKNAGKEQREFLKDCPKIGLYDDHMTLRCCKFLGDGAVGAQTAHLKEPYTDRPDTTGIGMYTDEELYKAFKEAADHGMQLSIHSIGDATIEQVLKTYKRLLSEKDYGDHRWRIEHFQTVTSNTPKQAAKLHVIPSMQPMHAPNSASMAIRRLGEKRIHGAYAAGLVLKSTGIVAFGSDAPVANPSPMSGIHAAVTRKNDYLKPEGGFCMENAVTPEEAMKGYTTWGAYAMFAEDKRGSLEIGKYADFAVLDQNPLTVAHQKSDDLLKIQALKTYIGGKCVYKR
jgi:predicted amidohydrolase YtcJ